MTNSGSSAVLSPPLTNFVSTSAYSAQTADPWHRLFERLSVWQRDPNALADDENEPPSGEVIQLAADLARTLKDDGFSCPDNLAADPSGGIVFEYNLPPAAVVYHIWDDGTIERIKFRDSELVDRRTVSCY